MSGASGTAVRDKESLPTALAQGGSKTEPANPAVPVTR